MVKKQPFEQFAVHGSIIDVQTTSEKVVLGTSSISIQDKDGLDVTADILVSGSEALSNDPRGDYVENMLTCKIKDGVVESSPYWVSFLIITDQGNKYEIDLQVTIYEKP